ncbi:MAG: L,D-transpeptidase family protein [Desulfatiglandales bacterium]
MNYIRILCCSIILISVSLAEGEAFTFRYNLPPTLKDIHKFNTMVGSISYHQVKPKETFLDIARNYGLGFNELEDLYPGMDPWIPPPNTEILLPTQWLLPLVEDPEIVINVAEMRLYYFRKEKGLVETYPIGIGDIGYETPVGSYKVVQKRKNPYWYVPKSLWNETTERVVPPGPDNPLGEYWLGLSLEAYGIHGTNFPWAIGRLVTLGCIRLYPEHIKLLYEKVAVGTKVTMIYEPLKVGFSRGMIFVEVHSDRYSKKKDLKGDFFSKVRSLGLNYYVDEAELLKVIYAHDGVPHRVGYIK